MAVPFCCCCFYCSCTFVCCYFVVFVASVLAHVVALLLKLFLLQEAKPGTLRHANQGGNGTDSQFTSNSNSSTADKQYSNNM